MFKEPVCNYAGIQESKLNHRVFKKPSNKRLSFAFCQRLGYLTDSLAAWRPVNLAMAISFYFMIFPKHSTAGIQPSQAGMGRGEPLLVAGAVCIEPPLAG